ncbi:MAG: protein kinase [Labilithrix sp.]|nr:protein kinase [Labilithrix sp.]
MGVLRPGQMLEGTSYQVVREIGAGGMGVVYEIEHVRLKKRYVAKVIHDQIRNDEGAAKRMEREAQVLAGISHPNVVQVHDIGTTQDGVSYFVMEKLEGVDLRHTMKRVGLTRLRSIEVVTDVLSALEYVHRRGIVHRDIKPENIFLAEQPRGTVTKVLDFGIVHIFDSDGRVSQGRITKTGGFVGTLYYAAPEQMQGKAAGPPNDVYAAGLVLFEMLAGKGPFDDDPGVGLSRCFKPAPLLSELVPTAPPELSRVVARALEQDPARRPSAGELATELRAVSAALKSASGGDDDDAVRAEVDDLLRHMAPVSPLRPAAGRAPTGDAPSVAIEPTAVPPTPMMEGAPRREPTDPRLAREATMASATGDGPAPGASGATAGPPHGAHPPTMPGVGVAPAQRDSAAGPPPGGSPQPRLGTPPGAALGPAEAPPAGALLGATPLAGAPPSGAPVGAQPSGATSPQAGPQLGGPQLGGPQLGGPQLGGPAHPGAPSEAHLQPRVQTGPTLQHLSMPGAAPAHAVSSPPRAPSAPELGSPAPAGPAQLFGATIPVQAARFESVPGAPARQGDNTSPGVYATVDNQAIPTSVRVPVRPPWGAIAGIGAIAVILAIVGGTFAYRQRAAATEPPPAMSTTAPSPPTAETAASAPMPPSATDTVAGTATTPSAAASATGTTASATGTTASATGMTTGTTASATGMTASAAGMTAGATATGEPRAAAGTSRAPAPPPTTAKQAAPGAQQPPARSAAPAPHEKPSTPAGPRASSTTNKPGTPKDDYMPW